MAFEPHRLRPVSTDGGFTLWNYQTCDPASAIIKATYFNAACDLVQFGDRIMIQSGDEPANFFDLAVTEVAPKKVRTCVPGLPQSRRK